MDILINVVARFSLLLCTVGLAWLAYRLHSKAKGKGRRKSIKKTAAVLIMFLAGLALAGTVVGGWVGANIGAVGGYAAAALVLFTVGPVVVDWVADGEPDKVALWCMLAVPLALVVGFGQLSVLAEELGRQGERLSDTVSTGSGR